MKMCVDCSENSQHRAFDSDEQYAEHRRDSHGETVVIKPKPKAPGPEGAPVDVRLAAIETELSAIKNQLATVFTDLKLQGDRIGALEDPSRLAPIA